LRAKSHCVGIFSSFLDEPEMEVLDHRVGSRRQKLKILLRFQSVPV